MIVQLHQREKLELSMRELNTLTLRVRQVENGPDMDGPIEHLSEIRLELEKSLYNLRNLLSLDE